MLLPRISLLCLVTAGRPAEWLFVVDVLFAAVGGLTSWSTSFVLG